MRAVCAAAGTRCIASPRRRARILLYHQRTIQLTVQPAAHYSVRPIVHAALSLTALGLLVRASSAFKEIVFAYAFGVSADTDVFVLAGTYAMFLPTVVGGAVATALISGLATQGGGIRGRAVFAISVWIAVAAVACAAAIYVFAPLVMSLVFGLRGDDLTNAVAYARILSPLGITILLASALSALLNSAKQFYFAGAAAVATPAAILLFIYFFGAKHGVAAAAWGTACGGIVELSVLAARTYARRRLFFTDEPVAELGRTALNFWRSVGILSFATSVSAISAVVDQFFLAKLEAGSITSFNYASKVNSLLIGVFGTAFSVAIYPYLTDLAARRDIVTLKHVTWRLAALVLPAAGAATVAVAYFSYRARRIAVRARKIFRRGRAASWIHSTDIFISAAFLRCGPHRDAGAERRRGERLRSVHSVSERGIQSSVRFDVVPTAGRRRNCPRRRAHQHGEPCRQRGARQAVPRPASAMSSLTIFTPTFNRASTLPRLFASLERQTLKDFVWLVVDDGSVDATAGLIDSWRKTASFPVKYIYQTNQGKHNAHNVAVSRAATELFVIVDSDDELLEHAVQTIVSAWQGLSAPEKQRLAGVWTLCCDEQGQVIGGALPREVLDTSLQELRYRYKDNREMLPAFATAVLREHPFPSTAPGACPYIPEDYVWSRITRNRRLRILNVPCRVYHRGAGLLAQARNEYVLSKSAAYGYFAPLTNEFDWFWYEPLTFVEAAIQAARYGIFSGEFHKLTKLLSPGAKMLVLAVTPIGVAVLWRDRLSGRIAKQLRAAA